MDFLPKELEDIIIDYKIQLEHSEKYNKVISSINNGINYEVNKPKNTNLVMSHYNFNNNIFIKETFEYDTFINTTLFTGYIANIKHELINEGDEELYEYDNGSWENKLQSFYRAKNIPGFGRRCGGGETREIEYGRETLYETDDEE